MERIIYYKDLENGQYIQGLQNIESVERYPGSSVIQIKGPKSWEGKLNIKTDAKSQEDNINNYFPEFRGVIFLRSLETGTVSFQGSGALYLKDQLAF